VGLLREKSEVKTTDLYDLMKNETKYAKAKWTEKLGVSTSGFYTWLHDRKWGPGGRRSPRGISLKSLEDKVLDCDEKNSCNSFFRISSLRGNPAIR